MLVFGICAKQVSSCLSVFRSLCTHISMLVALLLLPASVWAQVCAAPGNDGLGTASGVVNDYFPGASASTLAAGSTSLTLGTQRTGAANKTLVLNDLLLVIQMQDASINAVNTSAYGNGGSGGQGSTSVGSTGLYEFVKVTAISGSTVTFSPALTNTYRNAAAVAGISGQKTYQVVRVPQYTSASVSGVTAPPWNGSTGGVVAIDARDTLTLNGTTVENQANRAIFLAGKGFRGAVGSNGSNRGSREDWMGDYSTAGGGGGKGEGIAGTPRYMANKAGTMVPRRPIRWRRVALRRWITVLKATRADRAHVARQAMPVAVVPMVRQRAPTTTSTTRAVAAAATTPLAAWAAGPELPAGRQWWTRRRWLCGHHRVQPHLSGRWRWGGWHQ